MATTTAAPATTETTERKAPLADPECGDQGPRDQATQDPLPAGLRIGVVGGGCSGFQYSMSFENQQGMMDKVLRFEGLRV
jgi:hypothetical protein